MKGVAFGSKSRMNVNTDTGCGRIMDPDMVLSSRLGLDIPLVQGGNAGHSDWPSPCCIMALRHQPGPRCRPRPQASAWPSVATEVTDINSCIVSCFRASDQDWPLAVVQAWISPWSQVASKPFTTLTSSELPLSPTHVRLHISFSTTFPRCTSSL